MNNADVSSNPMCCKSDFSVENTKQEDKEDNDFATRTGKVPKLTYRMNLTVMG